MYSVSEPDSIRILVIIVLFSAAVSFLLSYTSYVRKESKPEEPLRRTANKSQDYVSLSAMVMVPGG